MDNEGCFASTHGKGSRKTHRLVRFHEVERAVACVDVDYVVAAKHLVARETQSAKELLQSSSFYHKF
jgi:hypothetical protein